MTARRFLGVLAREHAGFVAYVWFTGLLAQAAQSATPYAFGAMLDALGEHGDSAHALRWVFALLALYVAAAALWRAKNLVIVLRLSRMLVGIRDRLLAYIDGHSHRYFGDTLTGALTTKIGGLERSVDVLFYGSTQLLQLLVDVAVAIVILWTADRTFAFAFFCWAIADMLVAWRMLPGITSSASAYAEARAASLGVVSDRIGNIQTVMQYAAHRHEDAYLAMANDREWRISRRMRVLTEVHIVVQWFMFIALQAGGLWYGLVLFDAGSITIGELAMLLTAITTVGWNMWSFSDLLDDLASNYGGVREGIESIYQPHEIVDAVSASELRVPHGAISFEAVRFSYEPTKTVFDGLTLDIPSGQKLGIVGRSGAGKTTFVNLLLRMYEPQHGRIEIDGQDLRAVTQESLRSRIALVPQDPSLFHRTIRENIRYGRPDATDDEVLAASLAAQCDGFIRFLPHGYDSLVGERGVKLSGGQRQRIALARAILKAAPVLVLDEATSSLDSESEAQIQEALELAMRGRTVVAIAHRLSTLRKMDRIVVLDGGTVTEDGAHEELLANGGIYAALWHRQVGGFLGQE